MVKEVKKSVPLISMYQLPFHSLPLNKVKNIEVDRLRLSFSTPQKRTMQPVPVDSDEDSDDEQEWPGLDTVNSEGWQGIDMAMEEGLDHICSGLHAIPRKNRSRSTKKRVRKASCKEFYKIFS